MDERPGRSDDDLSVEFLGMRTRAVGELGFGRQADIVLDPHNRYLHGEAGRFRRESSGWVLHNTGTRLPLRLLHQTGMRFELPPGTHAAVPAGHARVQLQAGPTLYELEVVLDTPELPPDVMRHRTGTLFYGRDLSPAQVDYAVTLAAPRLRGEPGPLPTQAEIARRWGVSQGTVRRTFENIRDRLRDEGVRRIDTPEALVDYLVVNGIVTRAMLDDARLDRPGGPVRRAELTGDR
ncbi:MAG: hypothetical protein ACFCVK_14705 [Acidimicrobiales bacterium]